MMARLSGKRRAWCALMRLFCSLATVASGGLTLFMLFYILCKGLPEITWTLLSTSPSYLRHTIGILPDIMNTLYIVIASLIMVLPIGVGAAIYLNEYAKSRRLVAIIEFAAETLSGIPSIIYGLAGMLIFCQFLGLRTSLISGSMTLVIMNIPTIMRTTEEALKSVPESYREGAFALGAGKWKVIRSVVLPPSSSGILTGCILATGRMLGESAALLFTAGFAHSLNGFFNAMASSGATLTVALYVYAREQGEFEVAYAIAAILMILTLIINLATARLGALIKRRSRK